MLQDLGEEFLKRYEESIAFYGRYVNDSFIIIAKNKLNLLLRFLNEVDLAFITCPKLEKCLCHASAKCQAIQLKEKS